MRSPFTLLFAMLLTFVSAAVAAPQEGARSSAGAMRAKHAELAPRLAASAFGKPLYLEAAESGDRVSGDAFAVLDHAFTRSAAALSDPFEWCEILLLPFNTKQCQASPGSVAALVGRRYSTPIDATHRLELRFEVRERSADYLRVELTAPSGPFGTRDYRIVFELSPLDERRSFMHFGYSYAYGTLARTAMQAYLATFGARKVGFTRENDGLVRGLRGVMERNTMRYFLAIEAYLRAMGLPARERPARMIEEWFASIERYPRQLHELERGEYVPMKLAEYERMHNTVSRAPRTASSSPSPS
jgi:hypothetical protein